MITVLVSDEDARKIFRRATDQREALADLPRTEPGIHKNTGFSGFHIGAVARGTASQNRELNGHGPTLDSRDKPGNDF